MLNRLTYELTFRVQTLLHVGSGMYRKEQGAKKDETFEVSTVSKDAEGKPWIPGSSLKGAFRSIAFKSDLVNVAELFGRSHEKETSDIRGALSFAGAVTSSRSNTFLVRKHTRIHRGTGTSEANLLFAREYVEVGTEFKTTVTLRCRQDPNGLREAFEDILAQFVVPEGVSIGAGKSDHLGAIRLEKVARVSSHLTEDGWQSAQSVEMNLAPVIVSPAIKPIYCVCPGLYLSKSKDEVHGYEKTNIISPEISPDGLPRLLTTGVSGYLRARAEWLSEVYYGARGKTPKETMLVCKTSSGQRKLDVVQRLFGDEGYRARLTVRVADIKASEVTNSNPHIALDQLTQEPFKNALFVFKAHHSVSFNLCLSTWAGELKDDETQLLTLLQKDIDERGLMLGMGTSKGYGWFNCEAAHPPERDIRHGAVGAPIVPTVAKTVTLPYRFSEASLDHIGMPQSDVVAAYQENTLHRTPFENANSGYIDVSWLFETPMLIGAMGDPRAPQKVAGKYIVPGATIRGAMRAGIEAAVNARLTRVNRAELKNGDKRPTFNFKAIQEKLLRESTPDDLNPHRPPLDEHFVPDFAAALFGFVGLGDEDPSARKHLHKNLHLKSRIRFGTAWHVNEYDTSKEDDVYRPYRAAPDATAVFYDHAGRKQYIATHAATKDVLERLEKAHTTNAKQSDIQFLHPSNEQPLIFRQRIGFHNLTDTELGALIWVLTLGFSSERRHRVGHAKAFGAGLCRAQDINLGFTHDHCGKRFLATEIEKQHFGFMACSSFSYRKAFGDYLDGLAADIAHGRNEYLQAADPAAGQGIRDAADLKSNELGYQTSQTFEHKERQAAKAINNGRLAAMLRKAPQR